MPVQFPCQNCGKQLKLRDGLVGKHVKCPHCQTILAVPLEGTEIQEGGPVAFSSADFKDCPECGKPMPSEAVVCLRCGFNRNTGKRLVTRIKKSTKKQTLPQQLQTVRLGLAFHYARLVIFLATPVVLILALILGALASAAGPLAGLGAGVIIGVVGILLILALLATPALGMVGSILCAWAPQKKARTLILISFGLDLGSFGVSIVQLVLRFLGSLGAAPLALFFQFLQMGLALAAWVLFMLFLRRLAYEFEEWGRADEAGYIVYTGAVLIIVPPLVLLALSLLAAASREGANVVVGLMFILVFVYIYLILRFTFRQLEYLKEIRGMLAKQIAEL